MVIGKIKEIMYIYINIFLWEKEKIDANFTNNLSIHNINLVFKLEKIGLGIKKF